MPLNIVFLRPQNWSRLKPYPKDPAVLKILRRSKFTIAVVTRFLCRFLLNFPQENKVFPRPVVFYYRRIVLPPPYPVLPFLVFWEFLVFFPCEDFLVFLSDFAFFSRDFRGSVGIKNPCFLIVFLAFFQKNKEGKDQPFVPGPSGR